jgi:hypothetical protein
VRIVYSFPDALGAPGIGTTALNQVKGLIARGHEVLVYCTSSVGEVAGAARVTTTLSILGRRIPHRALVPSGRTATTTPAWRGHCGGCARPPTWSTSGRARR